MAIGRRQFLKAAAALGSSSVACAPVAVARPRSRVVVVGAGYGGATAARYVRRLAPRIEVVLVEPNADFVSGPLSNLVVGGFRTMADITRTYATLDRDGVRRVKDRATAVDMARREVRLARGDPLAFDRVIVAPGIDFMWERLPGMRPETGQERFLHAWKPGPQVAALRRQLEAMRNGGVFAIAIPETPYRCLSAPYERACQVAAYLQAAKPRSKVLILDANGEVSSEGPLFKRAWAELYSGMIEYRPNSKAVDVDPASGVVKLELEDVKADVANVIPPQRAAAIAAPFVTANKRWCEIDWLTYESIVAPGAHVLGDALLPGPAMAKSGSMANAQAKACAEAVVALISGQAPNPAPTLINTCYSFVSDKLALHVASVHKYDRRERTMKGVPGAGGLSASISEREARYGLDWARNIWADILG